MSEKFTADLKIKDVMELLEENTKLRAELAEAVAVLKPFAEISLARDDGDPNTHDMIDAPDLAINPAQVRRARAFVERHKPKETER